jgi:hypothetical protein
MSVAIKPAEITAPAEIKPRRKLRRPWRRRPVHAMTIRRSYRNVRIWEQTVFGRALAWLLPWERSNYPGLTRGVATLLGKVWRRETIWGWRTGRTRCRPDVALALASEIERRADEGLRIAADLRAYAAAWRPYDRSRLGFLAIDPETGQNKRWRG